MVVRKDDMKFKLLSLVTIVLILFISIDVKADEYAGYIYESEAIPDMYFHKHREDTGDDPNKVKDNHRQAFIYRRSTDNALVYSIETWSNLYGSKSGDFEETTDEHSVNLTEEQLNTIKIIAHFGYGYKDDTYDHTEKKWYGIAQYLIWKVASPTTEINFTKKLYLQNPTNKYDNDVNELLYLVKNGTIKKQNIKDMVIGDTLTINSPNSHQELTIKKTDNITVKNNSNTSFTIKANKEGITHLNLIEFHQESNSFIFYPSKKFQDSMSIGNLTMINYAYDFDVVSGSINVNVYEVDDDNKNNKLNNVEYGLYAKDDIHFNGELKYHKDSLVSQSKTKNGKLTFSNLLKGKYYLKELSNMNNYYDDGKVIDIEINDNIHQDYDLYYHYQKLKINIKKLISIPVFKNKELYYSHVTKENMNIGLYNESNELMSIEKTNKKGEVEFALFIPYGKYYLKEINIDNNYIDDIIYELDFKRLGNNEYQVIDNIESINYMKEGNIVININNKDVDNKKITIVDEKKEMVGEYITDIDGKINLSLPYGKYYIKEFDDYEFIVNKEDTLIEGKLKEEIKDNTLINEETTSESVVTENNLINEETISGSVIREPNYTYEPFEVEVGKTGDNSYISFIFIILIGVFLIFISYDKKSYI